MNNHRKLYGISEFVLFITSYIPLFILILFKQFSENLQYLNWGGLEKKQIEVFITKFGFSTFLIAISLFSSIGCFLLFSNFNKNINNGENVILIDVKNRNSESIGYIATYIIPFIFQSFNNLYEIFAFLFLMLIIYRIYINSNLLLINPILSFVYSIYEVEYQEQNGKKRNGLIIIKDKHIDEETMITIYSIGHKLFFAKNR
ncbi:hypothetical protein [Flavobacterium columnare]|uniref:hypothetical protein n=1 Tax=Flavobacterium columnare TaxID=996 RepID=UPI000D1C1DAE|nr:hypothetical protein [Flavobacterium columnare]PTD15046.1 hypothetical protein C6N29_11750 [Flavobacterium columnare]